MAAMRSVSLTRQLAMLRSVVVPSAYRADRKSTRLNSSHGYISYAVFCLKKKKTIKYSVILYRRANRLHVAESEMTTYSSHIQSEYLAALRSYCIYSKHLHHSTSYITSKR